MGFLADIKKHYIEVLDKIIEQHEDFWTNVQVNSFTNFIAFKKRYSKSNLPFKIVRGATKMVVIDKNYDWVLKIPIGKLEDHCRKEIIRYKSSKKQGFGWAFAACYFLGSYKGVPIYAMEKADCEDTELKMINTLSDEYEEEFLSEWDDKSLIEENLEREAGEYKEYEKLQGFLNHWKINDFYRENVGYINGHLKIIDYSGYYE